MVSISDSGLKLEKFEYVFGRKTSAYFLPKRHFSKCEIFLKIFDILEVLKKKLPQLDLREIYFVLSNPFKKNI